MGEGVKRHPALGARERVASQVGDPGMSKLMKADGDDQKNQAE